MNRIALLLLTIIPACAIDEAEPICEVGATQACVCSTGEPGAQTCEEDGFEWGECKCEEPEPPEPEACIKDSDCPSETPLCQNNECVPEDMVFLVPGGHDCSGARARCVDGFSCELTDGEMICLVDREDD